MKIKKFLLLICFGILLSFSAKAAAPTNLEFEIKEDSIKQTEKFNWKIQSDSSNLTQYYFSWKIISSPTPSSAKDWSDWEFLSLQSCNYGDESCVGKGKNLEPGYTYKLRVKVCSETKQEDCTQPETDTLTVTKVPTPSLKFRFEKSNFYLYGDSSYQKYNLGDKAKYHISGDNVDHFEYQWKYKDDSDGKFSDWQEFPSIDCSSYYNNNCYFNADKLGEFEYQVRACAGEGIGNVCPSVMVDGFSVTSSDTPTNLNFELEKKEVNKNEPIKFKYSADNVHHYEYAIVKKGDEFTNPNYVSLSGKACNDFEDEGCQAEIGEEGTWEVKMKACGDETVNHCVSSPAEEIKVSKYSDCESQCDLILGYCKKETCTSIGDHCEWKKSAWQLVGKCEMGSSGDGPENDLEDDPIAEDQPGDSLPTEGFTAKSSYTDHQQCGHYYLKDSGSNSGLDLSYCKEGCPKDSSTKAVNFYSIGDWVSHQFTGKKTGYYPSSGAKSTRLYCGILEERNYGEGVFCGSENLCTKECPNGEYYENSKGRFCGKSGSVQLKSLSFAVDIPSKFAFEIEKKEVDVGDEALFRVYADNVDYFEYRYRKEDEDWGSNWAEASAEKDCRYYSKGCILVTDTPGKFHYQAKACKGTGSEKKCTKIIEKAISISADCSKAEKQSSNPFAYLFPFSKEECASVSSTCVPKSKFFGYSCIDGNEANLSCSDCDGGACIKEQCEALSGENGAGCVYQEAVESAGVSGPIGSRPAECRAVTSYVGNPGRTSIGLSLDSDGNLEFVKNVSNPYFYAYNSKTTKIYRNTPVYSFKSDTGVTIFSSGSMEIADLVWDSSTNWTKNPDPEFYIANPYACSGFSASGLEQLYRFYNAKENLYAVGFKNDEDFLNENGYTIESTPLGCAERGNIKLKNIDFDQKSEKAVACSSDNAECVKKAYNEACQFGALQVCSNGEYWVDATNVEIEGGGSSPAALCSANGEWLEEQVVGCEYNGSTTIVPKPQSKYSSCSDCGQGLACTEDICNKISNSLSDVSCKFRQSSPPQVSPKVLASCEKVTSYVGKPGRTPIGLKIDSNGNLEFVENASSPYFYAYIPKSSEYYGSRAVYSYTSSSGAVIPVSALQEMQYLKYNSNSDWTKSSAPLFHLCESCNNPTSGMDQLYRFHNPTTDRYAVGFMDDESFLNKHDYERGPLHLGWVEKAGVSLSSLQPFNSSSSVTTPSSEPIKPESPAPVDSSNQPPEGTLDTATCDDSGTINITGTAYDPDDKATPVAIHIYNGNTFLSDCAASGSYNKFNCNVSSMSSGNYDIKVYAIDLNDSSVNNLLTGTPRKVNCPISIYDKP